MQIEQEQWELDDYKNPLPEFSRNLQIFQNTTIGPLVVLGETVPTYTEAAASKLAECEGLE